MTHLNRDGGGRYPAKTAAPDRALCDSGAHPCDAKSWPYVPSGELCAYVALSRRGPSESGWAAFDDHDDALCRFGGTAIAADRFAPRAGLVAPSAVSTISLVAIGMRSERRLSTSWRVTWDAGRARW